jgi:hypothetical protein
MHLHLPEAAQRVINCDSGKIISKKSCCLIKSNLQTEKPVNNLAIRQLYDYAPKG